MPRKNAFYAQSGGVTAVINASACGLLEAAREARDAIGKVYAGRNGIIGALREDLIDTSRESPASIAALRNTPGGAFGSCRYKLKSLENNRAEYERLIEVFRAHNIGYFFYNGGGDSADTCLKISQISKKIGFPIQAIHIPKTVDNDLPHTDCCPGFGSVAKYVATSTLEASLDVASMCESSTKVFILEVMGRHAGWIAAAGGLAAQNPGDPPHIIIFPEIPIQREQFLDKVRAAVKRSGYCVIVASEGAKYADGRLVSDSQITDAFGHKQLGGVAPALATLIKDATGYKYHWAVADYLQRSARHLASQTDLEQAYAVGRAAIEKAVAGKSGIMLTIQRGKGKKYSWSIGEVALNKVANREKMMPRSFITQDGFGITRKAREYLQPLVLGEAYPAYRNGVPRYVRLKNTPVAKQLDNRFEI